MYPLHHLTSVEKLPHYAVIRVYNALPEKIKNLETYSQFRSDCFRHLCAIEPYSVDEYLEGRIAPVAGGRCDNLRAAK